MIAPAEAPARFWASNPLRSSTLSAPASPTPLMPPPSRTRSTRWPAMSAKLAPGGEESAKEVGPILSQQATCNVGSVVETGLAQHVQHASGRARLGIHGAVDHSRHPRQHNR